MARYEQEMGRLAPRRHSIETLWRRAEWLWKRRLRRILQMPFEEVKRVIGEISR
jgi:hypothetical protein